MSIETKIIKGAAFILAAIAAVGAFTCNPGHLFTAGILLAVGFACEWKEEEKA